jgi:homoserine kinase type II
MAVYTDVSDDEVNAFIASYDIGSVLSLKGIAEGVENTNFLLHTDKGLFILTLYEKRVHQDDLPFFISLMDHLAHKGINCPQPLRNRHGEALGQLAGRPAALVTFLEGMSVRRPDSHHCAMVGQALAQLHLAGADFSMTRANSLSVDGWAQLVKDTHMRAHEVHAGLPAEIDDEMNYLRHHWPRQLPTGIIHADLFPDNVFFLSGHLSGLIDFYFACTDALCYDLAICLNAWCFEADHSYNITKGTALIEGYQRIRPLTSGECDAFPVLARGAAFRFMMTRLVDWLHQQKGALVRPKNPLEYHKKLRFHQTISSISAYGLNL